MRLYKDSSLDPVAGYALEVEAFSTDKLDFVLMLDDFSVR
jgi:hypothetical protein